jgi:hypothetical protein
MRQWDSYFLRDGLAVLRVFVDFAGAFFIVFVAIRCFSFVLFFECAFSL